MTCCHRYIIYPGGQSCSSSYSKRVDPFTALCWALDIVLANTWPYPLDRHHSTAVQAAWLYKDLLGLILNEDALPPPLSYLGMLFIYALPLNLPISLRQVINDLLEDLTRLDSSSERLALRGLNNNDTSAARGKLTKQSSVLSGGSSRGSGPDSLLLETQTGADRVSKWSNFNQTGGVPGEALPDRGSN